MRIDSEHKPKQEDEFYQLDIIQSNFQGSNGNYGGLFSGGRYGFEQPNHGNAHENVPCWAPAHGLGDRPECSVSDNGATIMLLGVVLVALAIKSRFGITRRQITNR